MNPCVVAGAFGAVKTGTGAELGLKLPVATKSHVVDAALQSTHGLSMQVDDVPFWTKVHLVSLLHNKAQVSSAQRFEDET